MELVKALEAEAIRRLKAGNFQQAERIYWQILEYEPHKVEVYESLGVTLIAQEKLEQAIACLQKVIEFKPEFPEGYYNLANALTKKGQMGDAIDCYQRAIILKPDYFEAYKNLGNAFLKQGYIDEAIDSYQQAVALDVNYLEANYVEIYNNMGMILEQQGQIESAIACYQQAINLDPTYIEAYNNLGSVFLDQGQLELAIACYQQALNLDPTYIEAYNNLGIIFTEQGQLENAVACYQQALDLNPSSSTTYNNLGVVFRKQGQLELAIACYQQALDLHPSFSETYNNLGGVFEEQGEYKKAKASYMQALELNPNYALAHLNLGLLLLRDGEFELGLAEYEWRWRCPQNKEYHPLLNLPQPLWDGSNLNGQTLLLHAEQGLGDTIQFIRYARLVTQLGGRVIVECQKPLVRLLKTVAGIEQIVVKGETLPQFHVHALMMSLPQILGTTIENIPAQVPYVAAPESPIQLKALTKSRLKVGLVWAGSAKNPRDSSRSCSLNHFRELVNIPNITFYSLQKEPPEEEWAQQLSKLGIQDLSSQLGDFADTAAAIAQLDLVISVDTAVAHLAGALNRPVWTLLSFVPDWRWMIGSSDSPWYPSMRLFRQQHPGDWAGLLKQVETALRTMVGAEFNAADSVANLSIDSSGVTKRPTVPQGKGFKPRASKKRQ